MGIADWPEDRKPREKLLQRGAESLTDAELLAIILRTGVKGKSAVDLGRELLQAFKGFSGLLHAAPAEIRKFGGLGPAKSAQVAAVLAIVKRSLGEEVTSRDNLSSPGAVRDYLRLHIAKREREVFVSLYLDAQNHVIAIEELFSGTLTQTSVYPREVVRFALQHNAAAVIFAHNHPSGVAEPSRADEVLTQTLKSALALVDVKVLDHFVIAGNTAMSFAERGLM
jgi:DNA repair protein RadC